MTRLLPLACLVFLATLGASRANAQEERSPLDAELRRVLVRNGFTGDIESTLVDRLGYQPDLKDSPRAQLGRFLFFDKILGLHDDHSCAGCHSPSAGWGDTQSIAIGIQSNGVVGPNRSGPRNMRRSPSIANAAFYPALMWDGRFSAPSGDPFDNSLGFDFPEPEDTTFPANDEFVAHLLAAQAFVPVTQFEEMAGFTTGDGDSLGDFDIFADGEGTPLPLPDATGWRHEPIRQAVLDLLNASADYPGLFAEAFEGEFGDDGLIEYWMVGAAIAEFEFTQVLANAPIDDYARGNNSAMTVPQKKGALVFFGKGQCVSCHAVRGDANEMFSDFKTHVIAAPQVAPKFGVGFGNVIFDGSKQNQDFGLEHSSGDASDRYMFRTAPLRNLARSPAFFHDGAFVDLASAIVHHLDVDDSLAYYDADDVGISEDLQFLGGPRSPMLDRLDPLLTDGIDLTDGEIDDLVAFVGEALLDPDASLESLCFLVPESLPAPSEDDMELFTECESIRHRFYDEE